jgi:hypothetical protein
MYWFIGFLPLVVGGMSFVWGVGAAVAFPHWKRAAYIAGALARTAIIAAVIRAVWPFAFSQSMDMAAPFIVAFVAVHGFGGVVGVLIGRRLMRTLVQIVWPPRLRGPLAYLWTVDGLSPPSGGSVARKTTSARPQ